MEPREVLHASMEDQPPCVIHLAAHALVETGMASCPSAQCTRQGVPRRRAQSLGEAVQWCVVVVERHVRAVPRVPGFLATVMQQLRELAVVEVRVVKGCESDARFHDTKAVTRRETSAAPDAARKQQQPREIGVGDATRPITHERSGGEVEG